MCPVNWRRYKSGTDELATKQDLKIEVDLVRKDMAIMEGRIDGRLKLMQWMVGLSIALSTATFALLARVAISLLTPH